MKDSLWVRLVGYAAGVLFVLLVWSGASAQSPWPWQSECFPTYERMVERLNTLRSDQALDAKAFSAAPAGHHFCLIYPR